MNREKKDTVSSIRSEAATITVQEFDAIVERKKCATPQAFAAWVRQLLQGWRQGTVGVKDRSAVNLSGKKPWKQKGTGRARAGTARSPLWRKGGVVHGPQPRVRLLKTNKKQKGVILSSLFWNFLENGKIQSIHADFNIEKPKTAVAHKIISDLNLLNKKVILFLSSHDVVAYASFINLPNVHIVCFDEANAFDLSNVYRWLVFEKDLEIFKTMVAQWL